MSHLKDQLTREIAGIILRYVRNEKGRLSEISRDSRINRREFTIRGLAKMKLRPLSGTPLCGVHENDGRNPSDHQRLCQRIRLHAPGRVVTDKTDNGYE